MNWFSENFFKKFKTILEDLLQKKWNSNWKNVNIQVVTDTKLGIRKNVCDTTKCISDTVELKMKLLALDVTKNCLCNDDKVLSLFMWMKNNIKYSTDKQTTGKQDYWMSPDESFSRKVMDCEDMALLLNKLCELVGISSFRRKIVVGNTKYGYHAYFIYLRELSDDWFVLDNAMHPEVCLTNWFNNTPFAINECYLTLDYGFNEQFAWAQHDMLVTYDGSFLDK